MPGPCLFVSFLVSVFLSLSVGLLLEFALSLGSIYLPISTACTFCVRL